MLAIQIPPFQINISTHTNADTVSVLFNSNKIESDFDALNGEHLIVTRSISTLPSGKT